MIISLRFDNDDAKLQRSGGWSKSRGQGRRRRVVVRVDVLVLEVASYLGGDDCLQVLEYKFPGDMFDTTFYRQFPGAPTNPQPNQLAGQVITTGPLFQHNTDDLH